ncbi:translin-associated factor X [Rhodotorula toruloides]|uniref:Translin-associated factor X n=1 Tax=Rhodotorula toruloides TaxID=5286 RepID=A0A511KG37_RHOTO|nr:translin-associated factor X [Rhodotorula toruloides]
MDVTAAIPQRSRADALLEAFHGFRTELDAHYAQRERIVKLSRDVTALSKQLIFALHRIGGGKSKKQVFKEVEGKMTDLRVLFEKLQGEVQGADFWRYQRSVSPGIQEYLEGFTFYYYLQHHSLPTLEEAQASLVPPAPQPAAYASDTASTTSEGSSATKLMGQPAGREPYFRVTVDDYLGGVADLTGELMRLAIASVGKNLSDSLAGGEGGGDFASIDKIGRLVREIKGEMESLAPYTYWLPKKLQVLDQSLGKIENASYNLRIRGAEYKDSPAMLQALARRMAEGGGERRGGDEVEASA